MTQKHTGGVRGGGGAASKGQRGSGVYMHTEEEGVIHKRGQNSNSMTDTNDSERK